MPRPRWEKLNPELKQTILDTASDEFARKGFDKASFNQIIEKAGLSKGAVYYYFDDKEDLFSTVLGGVVRLFTKTIGGFGPVSTPEQFWTEFDAFLLRGASFKLGNPQFVRLGIAMLKVVQNHRDSMPVKAVYREFMFVLEDIFRQGQEVGAVRRDLPADLLVAMVFSASLPLQEWYMRHIDEIGDDLSRIDLKKATRYISTLYRRLLVPGDEAPLAETFGLGGTKQPEQEDKR